MTMQGVTALLLSRTSSAVGNGGILEHPTYSPDMSPDDNDLSATVKELLRETRYNTRGERIRSIERSIRNINKGGRAVGV